MKHKLKLILKFILVFGLLFYLSKKGFISVEATRDALKEWQDIIPAIIASLTGLLLGIIRWNWLLRAQNIELKFNRVAQLSLIGNFFNIALPGAVSGDFVKAYYIGNQLKGQKARAFGSILFDRVAGLSALILVSATALVLGYKQYLNSPLMAAIRAVLVIGATCVLFFYTYLFLVKENHDLVLQLLRRIESLIPKSSPLVRVYESLRHYHKHRWTVVKVLLISALTHIIVGWAYLKFSHALGDRHLSLLSIYVVVPLGLLITAIPIAPAGVGTGNIAFLYFFHFIGSERGADVFSLAALTNIFFGLIGGLVYFQFREHEAAPPTLEN